MWIRNQDTSLWTPNVDTLSTSDFNLLKQDLKSLRFYQKVLSGALFSQITDQSNIYELLNIQEQNSYSYNNAFSPYVKPSLSPISEAKYITSDEGKFDFLNKYLPEYGRTLKTLFTPKRLINDQIANLHYVDVATTDRIENIDAIDLTRTIDNVRLRNGHRVLVKDQITQTFLPAGTNPDDVFDGYYEGRNPEDVAVDSAYITYNSQNGIYIFQNGLLIRTDDLDEYPNLINFTVSVKRGDANREKQFTLQRLKNGYFPEYEKGQSMYFTEKKNYVLRNRMDYNNIYELVLNDTIKHGTQSVVDSNITYNIPERTITVGEFGSIIVHQEDFSNFIRNKYKSTLRSICETNKYYWVCGDDGFVLRLSKIDFTIKRIVLQETVITRDRDGFQQDVTTKVETQLNSISYSNNLRGVVVGKFNQIWLTTDGGNRWSRIYVPDFDAFNFNSAIFLTLNTFYVGGDNGVFIEFEYSNQSWSAIRRRISQFRTPTDEYLLVDDIRDLDYFEDNSGFFTGTASFIAIGAENGYLFVYDLLGRINELRDVQYDFYYVGGYATSSRSCSTCEIIYSWLDNDFGDIQSVSYQESNSKLLFSTFDSIYQVSPFIGEYSSTQSNILAVSCVNYYTQSGVNSIYSYQGEGIITGINSLWESVTETVITSTYSPDIYVLFESNVVSTGLIEQFDTLFSEIELWFRKYCQRNPQSTGTLYILPTNGFKTNIALTRSVTRAWIDLPRQILSLDTAGATRVNLAVTPFSNMGVTYGPISVSHTQSLVSERTYGSLSLNVPSYLDNPPPGRVLTFGTWSRPTDMILFYFTSGLPGYMNAATSQQLTKNFATISSDFNNQEIYIPDYNDFINIVSPIFGNVSTKLNSFTGVVIPIINGLSNSNPDYNILNGPLALSALHYVSAIYGTTLSISQIESIPGLSTNTSIDYPGEAFSNIINNDTSGWTDGWGRINAQILNSYNPYLGLSGPDQIPGLIHHGWKTSVDYILIDSVTKQEKQIFEPIEFRQKLDEILDFDQSYTSASNVYHQEFFDELKPRLLFMDYDAGSKLYWFDDFGQYRLPARIFVPVSYLVDNLASTASFIQFKENSNTIYDGSTGVTTSYFENNWITYWKDRMKTFEYHTHLDDAYKVEPSFTFESSNYLSGIFTYTASDITTSFNDISSLMPVTSDTQSRFRDTGVTIAAPGNLFSVFFYKFLGIWRITIPDGEVEPKKGDVLEIESSIFKGRFIINKIFSVLDGLDRIYYQYFYTDFNENILNNLDSFSGELKIKNLNKYATTKGGIKNFTSSYASGGYSQGVYRKVAGNNRSSFDIYVNSNGEITSIQVIDSGFGFSVNDQFDIPSGEDFGGTVDITITVTELDFTSEFLQNFKSHYINYAYDIETVSEYFPLPEQLPIGVTQSFQITAKYNQFSAYYNLQANIEILTVLDDLVEIDMRYQNSFLNFGYSPTYNLLSYLNFLNNKKFLPEKVFHALPCYENVPGPDSGVPDSGVTNDNIIYMDFILGDYSGVIETNKLYFGKNLKPLWDTLMLWTFVDLILKEGAYPIPVGAEEFRTNRLLIIDKYQEGDTWVIVFHDKFAGNNNISSVTILSRRTLQEISDDLQYINNIQRPKWKEISLEVGFSYTNYESDIGYKISTDSYTKILLSDADILKELSGIVYTDYKFELAIQIVRLEQEFNLVPSNVSTSPNSKYLISLPVRHNLKNGEGVIVQCTSTQSNQPQLLGYRSARVVDLYRFEIDVPYTGFLPSDPLNIFYVKKDPFFNFQPCDIFDLGVGDKLPKQSIEITQENYDVDGNRYFLQNINYNKYRYRLIDSLDLVRLSEDFYWILDAEVTDAIIGLDQSNNLVWYKGTWEGGRWFGGTWISGTWKSGDWYDGTWTSKNITDRRLSVRFDDNTTNEQSSKWYGGRWFGGTWNDGTWYSGRWYGGVWNKGRWFDGTWNDGTWNDGRFTGGIWVRGLWNNGIFNTDSKRAFWLDGSWTGGDFENGVWYNGTFNSSRRVQLSRFGTRASNTRHSIWHSGNFLMGEFHSFLNLDDNGVPTVSVNHRNSTWHTGRFRGYFYGGNAYNINFKSSVWYGGVVRDISIIRIDTTTNSFTLDGIHRFNLNDQFFVMDGIEPGNYSVFGTVDNPRKYQVLDTTIDESSNRTEIVVDKLLSNIYGFSLDTGIINTGLKVVSNFESSTWLSGVWNNGVFDNGRFQGGIWYDGLFSGIWG